MGGGGNIDICPNCSFKMKKGRAPFKFHGSYVGKFEAYACDNCGRTYFTERALNEIMGIPLNPDEATNFSEETLLPPMQAMPPFVVYVEKKALSINDEFTKDRLDTFVVGIEDRTRLRNLNKQNDDLLNTA